MAYIYYNPNPMQRRVEDCSIRAVSKALNIPWEKSFALISSKAFQMKDMPHSNSVWGSLLKEHGFHRRSIPDSCPDCYTAEDFLEDHPKGIYVLGFNKHVATARDGNLYDSFDSSQEIPQYYWTNEKEE